MNRIKGIVLHLCNLVLSMEIWIAGMLVLASMISERALLLSVCLLIFTWIIRLLAQKRFTKRTPGELGILLLLLMAGVTLKVTAFPEGTFPQVLRLLLGILFYYSIVNWAESEARVNLVLAGVMAASLGLMGYAFISVQWATTKFPFIPLEIYEKFKLLVSDTIHPNVLAGTLVIIFPIALSIILFSWKQVSWLMRLLAITSSIGIVVVLLLTQSRGALLAYGIVLFLIFSLRWHWVWMVVPVLGSLLVVLLYRIGFTQVVQVLSANQALNGLDGRLGIWSRAIYMIEDFPFTGIGMGSFNRVADLLYPFVLNAPCNVEHVHNLFLQIAVDLGLPGLIAWLSLWLGILMITWQMIKQGKISGNTVLIGQAVGLFGSQVALGVHGILDAVTWGMVKPAPLVWALWGIAIAIFLNNQSDILVPGRVRS